MSRNDDDLWSWPALPPTVGSVQLRAFLDEDVVAARALSRDPYVPLIGTLPFQATLDQARDWVNAQRQRLAERAGFSFAIADRDSSECLGFAGLWLRQLDRGLATAGYSIVPAARGTGRGTEALKALTAFAWTIPGVDRIELYIEPWNVASQRVAEHAGYAADGGKVRHEIGGVLKDLDQYAASRRHTEDGKVLRTPNPVRP